jgi:hypothetical protein
MIRTYAPAGLYFSADFRNNLLPLIPSGDPDPEPESGYAIRKNAGSGSVSVSALNQCGSATLITALQNFTFLRFFVFLWVIFFAPVA